MKTLVVYYSRTGNTARVAEAVARALGPDAELEAVVDTKNRMGFLGYLSAGMDAMLGRPAPIEPAKRDPSGYDLVVAGTPIWSFTVSAPARTYLARHAAAIRRVAFFCTMDGSGAERAFRRMERACGREPVATMSLLSQEVRKGGIEARVAEFVSGLNRSPKAA